MEAVWAELEGTAKENLKVGQRKVNLLSLARDFVKDMG